METGEAEVGSCGGDMRNEMLVSPQGFCMKRLAGDGASLAYLVPQLWYHRALDQHWTSPMEKGKTELERPCGVNTDESE